MSVCLCVCCALCVCLRWCSVTDEALLDLYQVDRLALLKRVAQAYAVQIYVDACFSADPHPGNILVQVHNGKATPVLLDFGLTKRLTVTQRNATERSCYHRHCFLLSGFLHHVCCVVHPSLSSPPFLLLVIFPTLSPSFDLRVGSALAASAAAAAFAAGAFAAVRAFAFSGSPR